MSMSVLLLFEVGLCWNENISNGSEAAVFISILMCRINARAYEYFAVCWYVFFPRHFFDHFMSHKCNVCLCVCGYMKWSCAVCYIRLVSFRCIMFDSLQCYSHKNEISGSSDNWAWASHAQDKMSIQAMGFVTSRHNRFRVFFWPFFGILRRFGVQHLFILKHRKKNSNRVWR